MVDSYLDFWGENIFPTEEDKRRAETIVALDGPSRFNSRQQAKIHTRQTIEKLAKRFAQERRAKRMEFDTFYQAGEGFPVYDSSGFNEAVASRDPKEISCAASESGIDIPLEEIAEQRKADEIVRRSGIPKRSMMDDFEREEKQKRLNDLFEDYPRQVRYDYDMPFGIKQDSLEKRFANDYNSKNHEFIYKGMLLDNIDCEMIDLMYMCAEKGVKNEKGQTRFARNTILTMYQKIGSIKYASPREDMENSYSKEFSELFYQIMNYTPKKGCKTSIDKKSLAWDNAKFLDQYLSDGVKQRFVQGFFEDLPPTTRNAPGHPDAKYEPEGGSRGYANAICKSLNNKLGELMERESYK